MLTNKDKRYLIESVLENLEEACVLRNLVKYSVPAIKKLINKLPYKEYIPHATAVGISIPTGNTLYDLFFKKNSQEDPVYYTPPKSTPQDQKEAEREPRYYDFDPEFLRYHIRQNIYDMPQIRNTELDDYRKKILRTNQT